MRKIKTLGTGSIVLWAAAAGFGSSGAMADSISPASYETTLGLGDSVTIRKTVTIDAGAPADAPIDVMFLFDTTGSMGGEIAAAKSVANSVLSTLDATYGNLRSGSGYFADTNHGINVNLNSGNTGTTSGINDMWDAGSCYVAGVHQGCGGDIPEVGYAGLYDVATGSSWAPGSNRFAIVFGDATFKTGPDGTDTYIGARDALLANNVTVVGVDWGMGSSISTLATDTGGSVWAGGTSGADIAAAIIAGIGTAFDTYSNVTVDDLLAGLPGVGVSATCVSADVGVCSGDTATGSYDRSVARTFEFDVTFDALAVGDHAFPTHALVDGGIVATEDDLIHVRDSSVPEPGTVALLGAGLLGMAARRRRRNA